MIEIRREESIGLLFHHQGLYQGKTRDVKACFMFLVEQGNSSLQAGCKIHLVGLLHMGMLDVVK